MYLIILLGDLLTKANSTSHASGRVYHYLSQVGDTSDSSIFNLMEFIPKVLLDLVHIAPQIHSIGFNISYLLLVCSLLILIAINILR